MYLRLFVNVIEGGIQGCTGFFIGHHLLQVSLSLNVNGATRGCLGSAGCGGVFRDNKGVAIALFSNLLGSTLPLTTELVAIKLATCFFDQSARRCDKGLIIIESDKGLIIIESDSSCYGCFLVY
ncbi:hypothetical protein PVK06_033662 [Gossypium arboreum]|uniref:RNase H type-1 domain-containing protein n=1 Tax=Gossypium arboreum TaxID=29729 RepID=A0ABR0NC16_GOSAR|nr:hypothetical protein PVK06_033662 [Gossypium arboreum]